jgi:hypothetical protein
MVVAAMKPKTKQLLYFLLWSCEQFMRPTWRNLTDSFELWACRNGFLRQLQYLEKIDPIESRGRGLGQRRHRLTQAGRLHASGGRDPEACWQRRWDGHWRLALFDVPVAQGVARNRLRHHLRARGFGHLQSATRLSGARGLGSPAQNTGSGGPPL